MKYQLSDRVNAIQPSPTLAVSQKAAELKAAGHDVIGLGVGEPDFDTPQFVKDAAKAAIDAGHTKYTAVDGIPQLKQAVINKFQRDNGLSYEPAEILISAGGKHSIFNLLSAWLNPGDEVLIPAPYWVSYPDMSLLVGAVPRFIEAGIEQRYKITAAQLAAAITPATRLLFLNSPSNPTGTAYSKAELTALAEVLRQHPQVLIATDDMYEHILWTEEAFHNIAMVAPDLRDRIVILSGVSKAYAMTGWRIGYAAGPKPLIAAMKKIQSQSTSNPASISQYAALAALEGDQTCITTMVTEFKKRHDYLVAALNTIPGMQCIAGDGTFYTFANITELMAQKGVSTDIELCEQLLNQAKVALVPGSAFGAPGHCRFSFATSMATLEEAVRRIDAYARS
ncbi:MULTISPECIES: pyridoxal phosphate-dependent aminotransferase [Pseudidiomarina]|uniref:Aminotransferase n=4 Tax=Pseudidiomarina TaxID=2800384 RepID=A0A368VAM0_9GAMM|nr:MULTISPECIES: pyridoxal phosphate-dependent aminotransferase [Pseudidiomarina]MDT7525518.1 pyridoxal phosphate-dependent aminotransferase [Pseudidiomarina sp. GXY010]MDX1524865.1 pyridoxal phosphate-dependent aminotransferase [Pseudidiomarina maritima]PWW15919.1 aspartate aminotransferase [Pseudidiomarina maritima]RBP93571.1 aspartate aminotransferase [Pseudidiomarina tainanensis]RCW36031.1 aspartate aminotransferase [Pseudidiomarina tainanensis]